MVRRIGVGFADGTAKAAIRFGRRACLCFEHIIQPVNGNGEVGRKCQAAAV